MNTFDADNILYIFANVKLKQQIKWIKLSNF